ncbi:MAG: hypothetical protein NBV68_04430 [Erythrobacter sp.]|uniref:hypothetical protein n=1 Tax=Erythrobacter sp. TaxID=1042 RepID=UPI0025E3F151|nr:hypothetical protein [Erythrobacter sp.]MCL9998604.1 hypothetical protein [Erythrobacter sp.]
MPLTDFEIRKFQPAPRAAYLYAAFLGDALARFDGGIVVGGDGMLFSLPPRTR